MAPGTRWLDDAEQRMWRGYLDSTRLLLQTLDYQLSRDAGISLTDFEVLVALSEAPGRRLRMSELAEALTFTRGGVTKTVNRLVGAGWVRRVRCPEDMRGTLAELTDKGAAKLTAASPGHVAAVRANVFDLLDLQDVDRFAHAYDRMRRHMLAGRGEASSA